MIHVEMNCGGMVEAKAAVLTGRKTKIRMRSWFVGTDPGTVLYYSVSASDGSYKIAPTRERAEELFAQLVEFEKRQMVIKEEV